MQGWRSELANAGTVMGIWQQIPSPMISRFLAQMGWRWVILDMQHGCFNWETAYECIQTDGPGEAGR